MPPGKKTPDRIVIDAGGTFLRIFLQSSGRPPTLLSRQAALSAPDKSKLIKRLRARFPRAVFLIGERGVWTSSEKKAARKTWGLARAKDRVISDLELAYQINFNGKPGMVLSVGTGSALFGIDQRRRRIRAGGLGPLLGDEGSGFWFGMKHLRWLKSTGAPTSRLRAFSSGPDAVRKIAAHGKSVFKSGWFDRHPAGKKIFTEGITHLTKLASDGIKMAKGKKIVLVLRGGGMAFPGVRKKLKKSLQRKGISVRDGSAF